MLVYFYFIFQIQIFSWPIFDMYLKVFYLKIGESIIQTSKSQRIPTEFGPPVISRANVVLNRWNQESAGVAAHQPGVFTSTVLGKKTRSQARHTAHSNAPVRSETIFFQGSPELVLPGRHAQKSSGVEIGIWSQIVRCPTWRQNLTIIVSWR